MHAYYVTVAMLYGLNECWWSIVFYNEQRIENTKICAAYG